MSDFTNNSTGNDAPPETRSANPTTSGDVDISVLTAFEDVQREGEPDLIVELIDLYLADVPQRLSAIKDSILKTDRVSLKLAAHNLKGGSANLGVTAIASLCEELEHADLDESFQQADILFNRLEQTFARVRPIFLAERESRI